jgi:SAM-dependent methyltransferase
VEGVELLRVSLVSGIALLSVIALALAGGIYLVFWLRILPRWVAKASLQKCAGLLPCSHWWQEQLQVHVTRSLELTEARFESRLKHCRQHLENLRTHGILTREGFTAFDLGTGWHPVVPVGLFCCGASQVWTCDITPRVRMARLRQVLRAFVEYHENGRLAELLPESRADRVGVLQSVLADDSLESPAQLLAALQIHLLVQDARRLSIEDRAIDLVVSVASFEYIPLAALAPIVQELQRILSDDGVFSCSIDLSDEHAYHDGTISPFNFLRFSDQTWNWINNRLIPLNRLRVTDYRRVLTAAGLRILRETHQVGSLEQLQRIRLAQRFATYPLDDLLVLKAWFVARRAESIETRQAEAVIQNQRI